MTNDELEGHVSNLARNTDLNSKRSLRVQKDVTELKADVADLKDGMIEVKAVIKKWDFNGETAITASNIRDLIRNTPKILKTIDIAHELFEMAEQRKDLDGFWATISRYTGWKRGTRILVQLAIGALMGAIAALLIGQALSHPPIQAPAPTHIAASPTS